MALVATNIMVTGFGNMNQQFGYLGTLKVQVHCLPFKYQLGPDLPEGDMEHTCIRCTDICHLDVFEDMHLILIILLPRVYGPK